MKYYVIIRNLTGSHNTRYRKIVAKTFDQAVILTKAECHEFFKKENLDFVDNDDMTHSVYCNGEHIAEFDIQANRGD